MFSRSRFLRVSALILGTAILLSASALSASAQFGPAIGPPPQYAAFRVHNNTDQRITYQVRWTVDGVAKDWQTFTVEPGNGTSIHDKHHWRRWVPGHPFPLADWRYYDFTKGAWMMTGRDGKPLHPAAAIGPDPNGGFSNNFVLNGRDLIVGSSD
jgi:hypothetical protein